MFFPLDLFKDNIQSNNFQRMKKEIINFPQSVD